MAVDYQKVIDFMLVSGKRLVMRAGKIADIGIIKKDLTEEDLAIERGLKEIITSFGSDHALFAEEENDVFQESKNVWAVDPISSTSSFIKGLPHYALWLRMLSIRWLSLPQCMIHRRAICGLLIKVKGHCSMAKSSL